MSDSLPLAWYIDAVRYGRPLAEVDVPRSREDGGTWLAEIVALPLDELRHLLGQVARLFPEKADEVWYFLALREAAADQEEQSRFLRARLDAAEARQRQAGDIAEG